tara:strand:- start:9 stop:575 length:567 start_codon:yes stop_codon:yes gene_type:complete
MLGRHDIKSVKNALAKYVSVNKFAPAPSDILDILVGDIYPTPEVAWNLLPKSDSDCGYISEQMNDGWGACMDSMDRGDFVGARMAFVEAYKKSVERARLGGIKPDFFYSGPTGMAYEQKMELKHQKTLEAVKLGWLDSDSEFVRITLEVTKVEAAVALEDLTKRIPNLSKSAQETKASALADIRSKLR